LADKSASLLITESVIVLVMTTSRTKSSLACLVHPSASVLSKRVKKNFNCPSVAATKASLAVPPRARTRHDHSHTLPRLSRSRSPKCKVVSSCQTMSASTRRPNRPTPSNRPSMGPRTCGPQLWGLTKQTSFLRLAYSDSLLATLSNHARPMKSPTSPT